MTEREPRPEALEALGRVPPPPNKTAHRAALLAEARRLREQQAVSANGDVRRGKWMHPFNQTHHRGEEDMLKTRNRRRLLVAAVATVVIVLGGGLVASPELRALAQDILDLIVPGDDDTATFEFYPANSVTPAPTLETDDALLADIVAAAPFEVAVPTFMPDGYVYQRGSYNFQTNSVFIAYACGLWGVGIGQRPLVDGETPPAMEVGASATIEAVDINGATGQYVRGEWAATSGALVIPRTVEPGQSIPYEAEWIDDSEWQRLVWIDDGFVFTIVTASGLAAETATTCALDRDDYVAIARGLRSGGLTDAANLTAPATPALPTLAEPTLFERADDDVIVYIPAEAGAGLSLREVTWTEAMDATGFALPEPTMPDGFTTSSLIVNGAGTHVDAAYVRRMGSGDTATQSLFLTMERADRQAMPVTDGVGQSATVQQVDVGSVTGEAVRGMWEPQYDTTNAEPGQQFAPTPGTPLEMRWQSDSAYHRLRWQQGDVILTLAAGGRPGETLTLDDLIVIAESLTTP